MTEESERGVSAWSFQRTAIGAQLTELFLLTFG
jgi:hypothetical protein